MDQLIIAKGIHRADILEDAEFLENIMAEKDVIVVDAPAIKENLSVAEMDLDTYLQSKIGYKNREAKVRDISSLTGIFRIREGKAKDRLEKCRAIFVTTNVNLASASTEFLNKIFKEEGNSNIVQHCMTDVILTMRLWLKVPSQFEDIPRNRLIAHTLATLQPHEALYNAFVHQLDRLVERGIVNDDVAIRVRLAALVTPTLMAETRGHISAIDEGSTSRIIEQIVKQEENSKNEAVTRARQDERRLAEEQLEEAVRRHTKELHLLEGNKSKTEADNRQQQIHYSNTIRDLENAITVLSNKIQKSSNSRDNLAKSVAMLGAKTVKFLLLFLIAAFGIFVLADISDTSFWVITLKKHFGEGSLHTGLDILTLFLTAIAFMGLSYVDLVNRIEEKLGKLVLKTLRKYLNI